MKLFLPTYEQACEIVDATGKKVFYETIHDVDGYKVSIFNYRLAQYSDFIEPVKGKDYDGKELRGLTFVFKSDGNIVPRTKASFGHEMLVDVNEIFNTNAKLKRFVGYCLDNDLAPFFEYVSWNNRIVLEYEGSKLILLRVRDNETGVYQNIDDYDIEKTEKEKLYSLEEMMSLSETLQDKEGWVVEFVDGDMVKIKLKWYFDKHHLLLDSLQHDATVISMVLDETIDDAVSQLDPIYDKEKIKWVKSIEEKIQKYVFEKINKVNLLLDNYDDNIDDKTIAIRRFAMKFKKDENFPIAISVIRGADVFDSTKKYVKKMTDKLEKARKFLDKIDSF